MKYLPRWTLILLVFAISAFAAFLFWPGTSTGMMGAFLYSFPSEKSPSFDPCEYQEAVFAIARSHGFEVSDTNVSDRDFPKRTDEIFIPPSYQRQFSARCTATFYLCAREDRVLAVYIRFPSASEFDRWRIGRTMESIREDLRPIQKAINQKKI